MSKIVTWERGAEEWPAFQAWLRTAHNEYNLTHLGWVQSNFIFVAFDPATLQRGPVVRDEDTTIALTAVAHTSNLEEQLAWARAIMLPIESLTSTYDKIREFVDAAGIIADNHGFKIEVIGPPNQRDESGDFVTVKLQDSNVGPNTKVKLRYVNQLPLRLAGMPYNPHHGLEMTFERVVLVDWPDRAPSICTKPEDLFGALYANEP